MAINPNLKPFKPGKSGNPSGRPKDPPGLKKITNLTKKELVDIGNLVIKKDMFELKRLATNPKATVLQRMIASVAVKVISKGDMHALNLLLDRLVGKVKDEILHQGDLTLPPQIIVTLPDNGRAAKTDEDMGF